MHELLLSVNSKRKPTHGTINEIAKKYEVHRKTIGRIWKQIQEQTKKNVVLITLHNKKKGSKANPPIPFDENKFKALEKAKKTSLAAISKAMGVSPSTIARWKRKKYIRKHTNAIKPLLNDKNKLDRLIFCLSSCILDEHTTNFIFNDMLNVVHIDEKLFYITRLQQTFYLTPDEKEPHREIQSKRFIPKIMFICAVAKSIFSSKGEMIFDGKIGIFPFTHEVPAQRTSKYRKRGELETKPIQSITKVHTRDMIVHKILPAIKSKWSAHLSKSIFIQQDNAKPHILDDDVVFREAATADGLTFHLVQQPPNSPDMTVLELGFFRSIQALQHQKSAYNFTQLVKAVTTAFNNLQPNTMKYVWITLQACKIEVIKNLRGIDYHIPHMNKSKLAREGSLPEYLGVQKEIIYEALRYLDTKVDANTFEVMLLYLGIKDEPFFHQTHLLTTEPSTEPTKTHEPTASEATHQENMAPTTEPLNNNPAASEPTAAHEPTASEVNK